MIRMLLGLCLCLPQLASAHIFLPHIDLQRRENDVFKTSPIDHNENFFHPYCSHLDKLTWDNELQSLQEGIEQKLALPESLVRSFLVIAEGQLKPVGSAPQILPENIHTNYVRDFVQRSMVSHLVYADGHNVPSDHYKKLASNMEDVKLRFHNETEGTHPTIQFLVADPGQVGALELVEEYAELRSRKIVYIHSEGDLFAEHLIDQIQPHVIHHERPVLVFNEVGRNGEQVLALLQTLLDFRRLLGNASVMIIMGQEKSWYFEDTQAPLTQPGYAFGLRNNSSERSELITELAKKSDAIHFVRKPQAPIYYQRAMELQMKHVLHKLAPRWDYHAETKLENPDRDLGPLAASLFSIQNLLDRTVIKDIPPILTAPEDVREHLQCMRIFAGLPESFSKTEAGETFISSVGVYSDALYRAFGSSRLFGPSLKRKARVRR